MRAPHSIYFEVLGEHGWTGLVIFLMLGTIAFFTCSRTIKLSRASLEYKWSGDLAKMLQVSLVGYAAAGTFLNVATFDLYYHVLSIIVMNRILVGQENQGRVLSTPLQIFRDDPVPLATARSHQPVPDPNQDAETDTGPQLGGASGYLIQRR